MGHFGKFSAIGEKQVFQGVPGVPKAGNPRTSAISEGCGLGTPSPDQGVPGVPNSAVGTPFGTHPGKGVPSKTRQGVPTLFNENNAICGLGTPGTPGTPVFDNTRERHAEAEWDADDWQTFYDERVAIAEHHGGLSRPAAEARAWECSAAHWGNLVPPIIASADHCPVCNRPVGAVEVGAIPVVRPGGGHIWLHRDCHAQFLTRRRVEARRALVAMGLHPPAWWAP